MKNVIILAAISISIFLLVSCDKENTEANYFYKTENRTGLWITLDKSDTLEFVDDFKLIRKKSSRNEYTYRIEKHTLIIMAEFQNQKLETQHPILGSDEKSVKLGNMYITNGFVDNSATFFKD